MLATGEWQARKQMEQGRACILVKHQVQELFLDIGVSTKVMPWVGEYLKQCPGITYSWWKV